MNLFRLFSLLVELLARLASYIRKEKVKREIKNQIDSPSSPTKYSYNGMFVRKKKRDTDD